MDFLCSPIHSLFHESKRPHAQTNGTPQDVRIAVSGLSAIEPGGQAVVLSGSSPEDTNSINEPAKIVPVTSQVGGLGKDFTRTFPPYSVTVLKMKGK